ncbi:MAG TPA: alpha/beta hydrolase [Acidimicrobiia bacterium]|nr:alpha/beta hydrolase [Acidimicrobiia bacterium]
MSTRVDLTVDVTDAAGLGMPASTAVSVFLPDGPLADPPVVCFAFPGGGYARGYYSFDMPGASGGGQAGFHTDRGWVLVACDHLGVGDSTVPDDPNALTYDNVARANLATVEHVSGLLERGELLDGFAPVTGATRLGIGQSMGGCFTIVLQGQHAVFDGIAALGYSAIHTSVPSRPGTPPTAMPWMLRSAGLDAPVMLNGPALAAAAASVQGEDDLASAAAAGEHPFGWAFHYDDVPADIVAADLGAGVDPAVALPEWRSATTPACAILMITPGTVASEAAAITVPVLVAVGERDVVPDPWMEPKAFPSSNDITVFVCPRMAHMHNFAGTREQFWRRIQSWGDGVAVASSGSR